MKTTLLLFFIAIAITGKSQEYRFIGNNPLKVKLPKEYGYDGLAFAKKTNGLCNIRAPKCYPFSKEISIIDTTEFRSLTSSKDKILSYEEIQIDGHKATLIQSASSFHCKTYLYLVKDKTPYTIEAVSDLSATSDGLEQKTVLKNSKFDQKQKPDAVKDFNFTFDSKILKNMVVDENSDYPQIRFKEKEKYKKSIEITQFFKEVNPGKIDVITKNMTYSKLTELEKETSSDIEIAGLKGKEIIYIGKNRKSEKELNYRLILFDPNNKYFLLIKLEAKENIEENLIEIQKFAKTLKQKN